ncbi:hypothetical protein F4818DRAFT_455903 [Hypoxylon cercidicola]|nr:hypothetical protein F4818DRAFT_455903 [Hypoxylon cercidicola]
MPGRKGYDMTFSMKAARPQASEEIQQGLSSFNATGHSEPPFPSPLPTTPAQAHQEATDQSPRLSPGYSMSTSGQYAVYNQKTGRGWLRGSKSSDSSLPVTEPIDQDTSTDIGTALTRMSSGNSSHSSRSTTYDRAGIRQSMGSIAQRAIDRASRASLATRRLLAPAGVSDAYRLAQLPGLIHPGAVIAQNIPVVNAESATNNDVRFQSVPTIIVTTPSDDEDDNHGIGVVNSRGRSRALQPKKTYL